ncbi:MAG: methylaspartate mutase subunit S [Chthoniobacterales bacterium]
MTSPHRRLDKGVTQRQHLPAALAHYRVVIGVIGDDIHIVGNRIMQLAVEESGFSVYNLRTRNRPERFVQAALETNAHAVFVSSLNGEGEHWCADFRKRFSDVGLNHILLYVGGNIVVGKRSQEEVIALFKGFGFDRVYHQLSDIKVAITQLEEDLRHGQAKHEGAAPGN